MIAISFVNLSDVIDLTTHSHQSVLPTVIEEEKDEIVEEKDEYDKWR